MSTIRTAAASVAIGVLLVTAPASAAAFPAINGKIAFESTRDGNPEIYAMAPNGSAQTRLTTEGAADLRPAWSPDGQEIAFASDRDGNSEIYVMAGNGGGQVHLTDNPAFEGWPAWAPSGRQLAFESTRDGNWELYSMADDGSAQTRLTAHAGFDGHPAWSPDGRRIAFSSNRDGNLEIYAMNADGSGPTRLTTSAGEDAFPAWSPDGRRIAFVSARDGNRNIYVMNADGSGQTRLTDHAAADSHPTWQPLPPTPPPPPPPRVPTPRVAPPQVTAVTPAAPPAAGRPVVLTAQVTGSLQRLEWNVTGDSRPEIVSTSPSQTSLSFRAPAGKALTVSVRPVGPGGAGPVVTQQVTAPKLAAAGVAGRIETVVAKQAPVYAAGSRAALVQWAPGIQQRIRDYGCIDPIRVRAGTLDVEGCFARITDLAHIPAAERGIVERLAQRLGLPGSPGTKTLETAIDLTDAFVAYGTAKVNGVSIKTAGRELAAGSSAVVIYPQANAIASSNATVSVGDLKLAQRSDFEIDTRAIGGEIALGEFKRAAGGLLDIGKLDLFGDVDVKLLPPSGTTPGSARITATLRLPPFISGGGGRVDNRVVMRATAADGLIVDGITIGPLDADVGALAVKGLKIDYRRENGDHVWRGQGKACLVSGTCLDMIPHRGGVAIRNGRLDYAGATLDFVPSVPLFTGVNLEGIGFGFGLDPTRLKGGAKVSFAEVLVIDGAMILAFPTTATPPFVLRPEEIGGFPAHLYGRSFKGTTFGVGATARLRLPVLGEVDLARAHVLYEYPGYIAFGGSFDVGFAGVVSIKGGVDGELDAGPGLFNLHGKVDACVVTVVCGGAVGNVSRGAGGTGGAGACVKVGIVQIGGGVQWKRVTQPFIWPLDGCKWSRFATVVRAAQAGGRHVVTIGAGEPSRAIQLPGAPLVRVTGPGGESVSTVAGRGLVTTPSGSIRIARFTGEGAPQTVVGLQTPRAGTYVIEALAGSPPITAVAEAEDPPAARVKAAVRAGAAATGAVLRYSVRRRTGQSVTFLDITPDGAARPIGTVTGGRGKLRFTPAPGRGARRIEAQFELAGLPAERRTVARYRPPSPRLGRPARLRVRRHKTSLLLSWRRVPGATRYEVVTTTSAGERRARVTRARKLRAKGIGRSRSGRVTVRALAPLRAGSPARTSFRRAAKLKTRFRALRRCRVTPRLVCRAAARKRG